MTEPTRANLIRPLLRDTAVAVAVPVALGCTAGSPLPLHMPSADMLAAWWNTIQTDPIQIIHPLLTTLIYLLWISWAWHALWTTVALLWITLQLPALALPTALRGLTPAAAVQALALGSMLTTQTAHAATIPATSASHTHSASQAVRQLTDQHADRDRLTETTSYTVRPGDTLWSVAEKQLGHGQDWPAIYRENEDIPQATGGRLTDPANIRPGWSLTIPAAPDAATPAPPTGAHTAPGTAATPHHAPHTANPHPVPSAAPDGTTMPAPARDTTHPDRARPAIPTPRPHSANAAVPHTAGWALPNGYLGITLLSAIAACCASLLRSRTKAGSDREIPRAVKALASVARRAHAASVYGYLPEEQAPGATPPPTFTPRFGTPTLGVGPDRVSETAYQPERQSILALDGPGAPGAARALALSILAADPNTPPFPGLESTLSQGPRTFRIITDPEYAEELFGVLDHSSNPDWLLIAPTPAAALLAAKLHPPETAEALTSVRRPTTTVVFMRGTEADQERIVQTTGVAHHPVSVVLIGSTSTVLAAAPTLTQAYIAADGHVIDTRGPAAAQFTGLRLQMLPNDLACEIYRVLRNARSSHRQVRHTDEPASAASDDDANHILRVPAQARGDEMPGPEPADEANAPPIMLRLLGPIEIDGPAGTIPVTGDKTAALLALLALHPRGRTIAQIADQAWDGLDTSGTDAIPIRSAIARARTLLRTACYEKPPGAELITTSSTGFRLNSRWVTTDLAALDQAESAARGTANPAERSKLLQRAATLCRGELAEAIDGWDRDWLTVARAAYDQQATALAVELAEMDATTANRHLARLAAAS